MSQHHKAAIVTQWSAPFLGLACLATAFFAVPAQAQPRQARTFTCSSSDGQRTFCAVDMSNGDPRLTKRLGDVRCVEGYTWGKEDQGVWVDRGCRAEFLLPPEPQRPVARLTRIEPGTILNIRTEEYISADRADGRVFTASVDEDVLGSNGELAIPRGSSVEMLVRVAADKDLVLDLDSVVVEGKRYAIDATPERIDAGQAKDGVGANERTGRYVGGGAVLGAIIGAIAGGGKGAAIGAGVGAAGGAVGQTATRGREVRISSESLITFRVERPLTMGVADGGSLRDGVHYHEDGSR